MQEVEFAGALIDLLQHQHVQRVRVTHRAVEPQGPRPYRFKPRRGHRISTGEQRHLMPECDQFLRQPRHHAFGSPVKLRWNRLRQRCDLGNMHRFLPFLTRTDGSNVPSPGVPGTEPRTKNQPIVSKCSMNLFLPEHGTFTAAECHHRCAERRRFALPEKSRLGADRFSVLGVVMLYEGQGRCYGTKASGDADAWPIYVVTLIVLLPSFFVMCGCGLSHTRSSLPQCSALSCVR